MTDTQTKRCDELHHLGLKFNGEYYQDKRIGTFVHHIDIQCSTDKEWEKIISEVKKARIDHSNKPLTELEKNLIFECVNAFLETTETPFEKFSDISDLKDKFQPKFRTT